MSKNFKPNTATNPNIVENLGYYRNEINLGEGGTKLKPPHNLYTPDAATKNTYYPEDEGPQEPRQAVVDYYEKNIKLPLI